MDDFDDSGVGLPGEMTTELPDLETADTEVEIDIDGAMAKPAGRPSGGARAGKSSAAPKAAARKAAPAKQAVRKAKPAKKAAKKTVARKKAKPARKPAKKAKRKAGGRR